MLANPNIWRVVTLLSSLLFAAPAMAQEPMSPTSTQRAYNDRGVQHMFDGEFDQAASNFRSSLALGESNIALLNYGRALFKLKRCHEAQAAFARVPDAPYVEAPSPTELATVLDRFSQEWSASCTGKLTLECPDEGAMIRLDDGTPFQCHASPIPVMPGIHTVTVVAWDESFDVAVESEPAMLSLQRSLDEPPVLEDTKQPADLEASDTRYAQRGRRGTVPLVGLAVAAAGVTALGTSLALELAWVAPAFDAYRAAETPAEWDATREVARNRQRTNRILLFSGLGVTALGATLFVLPRKSDDSVAVQFGISGPTSVSATVTW